MVYIWSLDPPGETTEKHDIRNADIIFNGGDGDQYILTAYSGRKKRRYVR
jgi:hypothetical protein